MPDHVTKQLRDAIKAVLDTVSEVSGQVFVSRAWKFNFEELPAINLQTDSELITPEVERMKQPSLQRREIRNLVKIIVKDTENTDDTLDVIKLSVENKILSEPQFNGLCVKTNLESCASGVMAGMEEQVAVMVMVFVSVILTREGKAETNIGG